MTYELRIAVLAIAPWAIETGHAAEAMHLRCDYTMRYANPERAQAAYSNFIWDPDRKSLTDTEGDAFAIRELTDDTIVAQWKDMTFRIGRTDLRIAVTDHGAAGSGIGQCQRIPAR